MGGAPSTGFGYQSNLPYNYIKDLAVSYEVADTLLALPIGGTYNMSIIPSLIPALQIQFPEFIFMNLGLGLYEATRANYSGDLNRCCISNYSYYLDTNNVSIRSCNPATKTPQDTNVCNISLAAYCFNYPVNTQICQTWLEGYIEINGYDQYTTLGYPYCKDYTNPFCYEYLTLMRANPDSTQMDDFINQVRDQSFRCSFPTQQTLQTAKQTNYPRVCWDPQCIASPLWKLLYIDYVARLNCVVTLSDINFQLGNAQLINDVVLVNSNTTNFTTLSYGPNQNIYTKPLQAIGKGFNDFFSIGQFLFFGVFVILISF